MSESIDEIINAMAMKLQDAGLHDEGCFLVHELAADLFHMTREGSAVNPAGASVSDELRQAALRLVEHAKKMPPHAQVEHSSMVANYLIDDLSAALQEGEK